MKGTYDAWAEHVVGLVFEGGAYPKAVDRKGKGRAPEEPVRENKRSKVDYKSVERCLQMARISSN